MNAEYLLLKDYVDHLLSGIIPDSSEDLLRKAMTYGVEAPGKRIRGVLTMAFCRRLSVPDEQSAPFAAALEMIHAYSLIHDDMPEMDNDAIRRGIPTCHKKFGAATALLAGDGILNFSVEYLLSKRNLYQPDRFMNAMEVLYRASGAMGMLYGQMLDKVGEERRLPPEELFLLHNSKTGALLMAPIRIAEALSDKKNENYVNYSAHIGLAFQIKDDLLDVEGINEVLGKESGKDAATHKSTFVSILGVETARKYLEREVKQALSVSDGDTFLRWLVEYIETREK